MKALKRPDAEIRDYCCTPHRVRQHRHGVRVPIGKPAPSCPFPLLEAAPPPSLAAPPSRPGRSSESDREPRARSGLPERPKRRNAAAALSGYRAVALSGYRAPISA